MIKRMLTLNESLISPVILCVLFLPTRMLTIVANAILTPIGKTEIKKKILFEIPDAASSW